MKNYSRIKLAINEQANIVIQAEKRLAAAEQSIGEARSELAKVTGASPDYAALMAELATLASENVGNVAIESLLAEKNAIVAEAATLKAVADSYKVAVDDTKNK